MIVIAVGCRDPSGEGQPRIARFGFPWPSKPIQANPKKTILDFLGFPRRNPTFSVAYAGLGRKNCEAPPPAPKRRPFMCRLCARSGITLHGDTPFADIDSQQTRQIRAEDVAPIFLGDFRIPILLAHFFWNLESAEAFN